jgi:hypothetical protein
MWIDCNDRFKPKRMQKCIGLAFLLFFIHFQQTAAQTHIQTKSLYQTTTSKNISLAFSSASSSGNLIIVHIDWDGQSRSVSSVTDNKGNSYARISGPTNWNGTHYRAELWYAYNIAGAPVLTVTATLSGTPTSYSQIYISEYDDITSIDPLDQNSVAAGSSTAVSTGAKNTSYKNELIYGISIGASGTLSTGTGFINRSTANSNIVEEKKAATAGSYNAAFTSASGNWISQMASFTSTASFTILPIQLSSFTGKSIQASILLNWVTASEINNDYFSIERSDDGFSWTIAGVVKSAGDAAHDQEYSFTAPEGTGDFSYFRLKQTDLDGNTKYFNTLQVKNDQHSSASLRIYPNPSNGSNIFGKLGSKTNQTYTVEIFDNLGKMLQRAMYSQAEFSVGFAQPLPSGIYFIKVNGPGLSEAKCFVVSH